jgi:cation transport regulator ChaC
MSVAIHSGEDALFDEVSSLLSIRCSKGQPIWLFAYASLIWKPDIDYETHSVAALGGYRRRLWQACPIHRGNEKDMGRVATLVKATPSLRFAAAAQQHDARDAPSTIALGASALELWIRRVGAAGDDARSVDAAANEIEDEAEGDESDEEGDASAEWPVVHGSAYRLPDDSAIRTSMLKRLCLRERAGYKPVLVRVALADGSSVDSLTFMAPRNSDLFRRESNNEVARVVMRAAGASGPNIEYLACLIAAMRKRGVYDIHLESVYEALDVDKQDAVKQYLFSTGSVQ